MSILGFFFGFEPGDGSMADRANEFLDDHTAVNFDPEYGSHDAYHGVLGVFGVADREWRQYSQVEQEERPLVAAGEDSERLGDAYEEYNQARDEKPLWKFLLGI